MILKEDIEYLIIQNEKTGEIIAKVTQENCETLDDYIIRFKPISNKKD